MDTGHEYRASVRESQMKRETVRPGLSEAVFDCKWGINRYLVRR